jgi:hypothetical protein
MLKLSYEAARIGFRSMTPVGLWLRVAPRDQHATRQAGRLAGGAQTSTGTVFFVSSLCFLAFVYGVGTVYFDIFSHSLLLQAKLASEAWWPAAPAR